MDEIKHKENVAEEVRAAGTGNEDAGLGGKVETGAEPPEATGGGNDGGEDNVRTDFAGGAGDISDEDQAKLNQAKKDAESGPRRRAEVQLNDDQDDGGDDTTKTDFADPVDDDQELTDEELTEAAAEEDALAEAAAATVGDAIDSQIPFTTISGDIEMCGFSEGDRVNLRIQETAVVIDVLTCSEDGCTGKVVIDNEFLATSAGIPYGTIVKFKTENVISVG